MDAEQSSSSTIIEQTHPNADLISGLRECADWLEQHPELPSASYGNVCFGYAIHQDARARLTALAEALGGRATERRHEGRVTIQGEFGDLNVYAGAKVEALVDAPPLPDPEPIIKRSDIPVTPEEDDAWSAIS